MKKTAVLNSHISSAIATLGHYELLTMTQVCLYLMMTDV